MRERAALVEDFAPRTSILWRVDLSYTLPWCALLLWASLDPGSFWFINRVGVSSATQVMCACAILTPFFIPFVVYIPFTQTKGQLNPFAPAPLLSFRLSSLYWKRVVACWLFTLIPFLSVYVLFSLVNSLAFLMEDLVAPVILGGFFLTSTASLALLTSTIAVGLSVRISRSSHFIATAIAGLTVMSPFLFSEMLTGTGFESYLVASAQALVASPAISIFLLLSSLLAGIFFSWLYSHISD